MGTVKDSTRVGKSSSKQVSKWATFFAVGGKRVLVLFRGVGFLVLAASTKLLVYLFRTRCPSFVGERTMSRVGNVLLDIPPHKW